MLFPVTLYVFSSLPHVNKAPDFSLFFPPPTSGQGSWWRWSHVCGRKFLHCFGVRPAPYWWFWARHWSADHVPHRQQQHQGDAAFMSVSCLLGWIKPGFISTGYFWYFTSYDQLLHTHTLLMHTYKHMLHTHTAYTRAAHTHCTHTHTCCTHTGCTCQLLCLQEVLLFPAMKPDEQRPADNSSNAEPSANAAS